MNRLSVSKPPSHSEPAAQHRRRRLLRRADEVIGNAATLGRLVRHHAGGGDQFAHARCRVGELLPDGADAEPERLLAHLHGAGALGLDAAVLEPAGSPSTRQVRLAPGFRAALSYSPCSSTSFPATRHSLVPRSELSPPDDCRITVGFGTSDAKHQRTGQVGGIELAAGSPRSAPATLSIPFTVANS